MVRSLGLTVFDLEKELQAVKHLAGQHDQATHGNRFGRVGKNPRALVHIGGGPPGRNVHHYDENDEAATLGPHPAASEGGQEHAIVEAKYTDPEELPSAKKYMDGENFESEESGDKVLEAIYKDQGYDGKPHLVEDHELDAFVASGEPELFRGVGDVRFAKDYQDGPYFGGEGLFGNGTYTGKGEEGQKVAKGYTGYDGGLLRMTLKKEAKTIRYDDLEDEAQRYHTDVYFKKKKAYQNGDTEEVKRLDRLMTLSNDLGHYAAMKGYDAIIKPTYKDGDFYIVLNRTATRVQKTIYSSASKAVKQQGMSPELSRAAARALNSPGMEGLSFEERQKFVQAVSKCSTLDELPADVRKMIEDALKTRKK